MNKPIALLALTFILPVSGCSSPDDKAREAIADVHSWSATARMAARQWRGGATPTGYTMRTVETAQQNIREAFQQIASTPLSGGVATDVDTMVALAGAMKPAVEHGDRDEMRKLEEALARQEQQLRGDTVERGR